MATTKRPLLQLIYCQKCQKETLYYWVKEIPWTNGQMNNNCHQGWLICSNELENYQYFTQEQIGYLKQNINAQLLELKNKKSKGNKKMSKSTNSIILLDQIEEQFELNCNDPKQLVRMEAIKQLQESKSYLDFNSYNEYEDKKKEVKKIQKEMNTWIKANITPIKQKLAFIKDQKFGAFEKENLNPLKEMLKEIEEVVYEKGILSPKVTAEPVIIESPTPPIINQEIPQGNQLPNQIETTIPNLTPQASNLDQSQGLAPNLGQQSSQGQIIENNGQFQAPNQQEFYEQVNQSPQSIQNQTNQFPNQSQPLSLDQIQEMFLESELCVGEVDIQTLYNFLAQVYNDGYTKLSKKGLIQKILNDGFKKPE